MAFIMIWFGFGVCGKTQPKVNHKQIVSKHDCSSYKPYNLGTEKKNQTKQNNASKYFCT